MLPFRPIAPTYGARAPWRGQQLSDVQKTYLEDPNNAFASYLSAYPTTGQGAVSRNYRNFLEGWLPDMYRGYQGQQLFNPQLAFTDYLDRQDPTEAYQLSNPYGRQMRAYRGTRYLSR
jgi:hypothetical protein